METAPFYMDNQQHSFEEIYDLYFDAVNRYLRYRVVNTWDADDLTAAVFMKALENFTRYRGDAPFVVWLFRIAHSTLVDYLRIQNKKQTGELDGELADGNAAQPEESFLQGEDLLRLRKMLTMLPGDYRDVISLRYAGELKFAQISQVLGKTEAGVRMSHHRAIKMLRKMLNNDGHGR